MVRQTRGKGQVMSRTKNVDALVERECCICGRVFLPAVEHVFKVTGRWCCTYPCYLKLQAQIEAEKAAEHAKLRAERAARKARRREEQAPPIPIAAKDEKSQTTVKTEGEEHGN